MFGRLWRGLRILVRKEQVESELGDELRFHLEMETRKNERAGMDPEAARLAALRSFGGVDQIAERCRDVRPLRRTEALVQDVRYGLRMLRRRPVFTAMALAILALGIGANAAIFSLVRGVLLRPLPYEGGERLVLLRQPAPQRNVENLGFSVQELEDLREQSRVFEGLVEYHSMAFTLLGRGEPERVQTGVVSAGFFDVLATRPALGRTFVPSDEQSGAEPVLVLSHAYWQRSFAGDPDVIGQTIEMNDRIHAIVGVLPPLPQYPQENDVYMPSSACPFRSRETTVQNRQARMLQVFGRLRPEATLTEAQADLATIAGRMRAQHPEAYPAEAGHTIAADALHEALTRSFRPALLVLLGTAVFVLLTVCANVANLTLARLMARERELAVRLALGASRARVLRQLVTESLLLALLGGLLGLAVASGTLDLLVEFAGRFTTRAAEIRIDGAVLLFTLATTLLTGLVFGTLPALGRMGAGAALRDGAGRSTAGARSQRLRSALIVAQLAFSFVLLVGAGLMLRSLDRLQRVDPGFRPESVLTLRIDLNWSKYLDPASRVGFYRQLLERLRGRPEVLSAGLGVAVPLGDTFRSSGGFQIEGQAPAADGPGPQADFRVASADWFHTLGIPLLQGRTFEPGDDEAQPSVAVLSQSLARRHWGAESPVGRRISFDGGQSWLTVAGVVGDLRQYGLDREPADTVYLHLLEAPGLSMALFLRTAVEPMSLARTVRETIHALEPEQAVAFVQTLEQVRDRSLASPRLMAALLGLFAAVALVIAVLGLGGVVALSVSQRTQEIGIRMALGATPRGVLALVLRQGLRLVLLGLAAGAAGALVLGQALSGLLYGVRPTDPATFAAVGLVLMAAALGACLLPARRAVSIDPMRALRSD